MAPNVPLNAVKGTLSTAEEIRGTWTQEILTYLKTYSLWYALKHEVGDIPGHPGKLHIHFVMITEIIDKDTADLPSGFSPKAPSDRASHIQRACPSLRLYLESNPNKHSLKCHRLESNHFITEYMQKEGDLLYHHLPLDHLELRSYFADKLKQQVASKDYDHWMEMFFARNHHHTKDALQLITYDDIKFFVHHEMYTHYTMRVQANPIIAKNMTVALYKYITHNMDVPQTKDTASSSSGYSFSQVCSRCLKRDKDAPNFKEYRKQFCVECVGHPEYDLL